MYIYKLLSNCLDYVSKLSFHEMPRNEVIGRISADSIYINNTFKEHFEIQIKIEDSCKMEY